MKWSPTKRQLGDARGPEGVTAKTCNHFRYTQVLEYNFDFAPIIEDYSFRVCITPEELFYQPTPPLLMCAEQLRYVHFSIYFF